MFGIEINTFVCLHTVTGTAPEKEYFSHYHFNFFKDLPYSMWDRFFQVLESPKNKIMKNLPEFV